MLDISGCVSVTDKVLLPLLEFLTFSHPEGRPQLSMSLGGQLLVQACLRACIRITVAPSFHFFMIQGRL